VKARSLRVLLILGLILSAFWIALPAAHGGASARGAFHLSQALAASPSGSAWAWGDNHYGELGNGTIAFDPSTPGSTAPVRVRMPSGVRFTAIAAGWYYSLALAADASFVARSVDVDVKHLEYVLEQAARHKGTAFVEIYQNCNIFNDGAYEWATDKSVKTENVVYLEHGRPLVFGKENNRGIRLNGLAPEVVDAKTVSPDDLLIHDEKPADPSLAFLLSRMRYPEFPEPMGVFRAVERDVYGDLVRGQNRDAVARLGAGDLQHLITGDETWTVE